MALQSFSLNGSWNVRQEKVKHFQPAHVPGCIHSDLLHNGAIPDPYFRRQERDLQWIGWQRWIYTRTFQIGQDWLRLKHLKLVCEGLDTLATIRLNGTEIAHTDNMFRRWEFDVRNLLKENNELEIIFDPVLPYMEQRQKERRMYDWLSSNGVAYAGAAWVRKMPCNFGWDWGPRLVTCGIWKPIYLLGWNDARVSDVCIHQHHAPESVELEIEVCLENVESLQGGTIEYDLFFGEERVAGVQLPCIQEQNNAKMTVADPKLWWPNGMGAQHLYTLHIHLKDASGTAVHNLRKRIGLRTLCLRREKDAWGESFEFVANGIPFFAKGANWIPTDPFPDPDQIAKTRTLLESAKSCNMNMLRVWGGGYYPHDEMLDWCDEMGLCIWQDFMFACSTYPTFDDAFMNNVEAEARDNIRRMRHHACLALWCGNNELEQGLVGTEWTDKTMSWSDYGRLFDHLLPKLIRELDPQRDYWPCSPHNPTGKRTEFNNAESGDAHLWTVWFSEAPFESYRDCPHRFNSEFGFQSFPELRTVETFTEPEDRNLSSPVMEHHQRSSVGNARIFQQMMNWFRLPKDFASSLRLSQYTQTLAIQYGVEHWRRSMPRGMGTLYWQLNDNWPAASWSSIDSCGRWKALQYAAKRFYSPLMISGVENPERHSVLVHMTSDLPVGVRCDVSARVQNLQGREVAAAEIVAMIPARSNTLVADLDFGTLFEKEPRENCIVFLHAKSETGRVSDNFLLFARPKQMDWEDPDFTVEISEGRDGGYLISFSSARPALWVWLEHKEMDCLFSDNAFALPAGTVCKIDAQPCSSISPEEFRRGLVIHSLRDTYL